MAGDSASKVPSCQILNFFYDNNNGCALTAFINGVRFHIIVDADELNKSGDEAIVKKYLSRLNALKNEDKEDDLAYAEEHTIEEGLQDDDEAADSSRGVSPQGSDGKRDRDSAVDLSADQEKIQEDAVGNKSRDVEADLQNWILSAFGEETQRLAPADREPKKQSLRDWYHETTHFFELKVNHDKLIPERLEENADLRKRINELVPHVAMPKYMQSMDVPWYKASDIEVLSEIDDPEPLHPGEVEVGDQVQFFKPADPCQPQSTKREIKLLKDIEDRGLHDEIHAPKLLGLVRFDNSDKEIMGYLLTNIAGARPLTTLLDSDVPEEKRLKWADESKSIVQALHKHKIIWGDAKADNFLVDENDDLWIIDFGGSYTEGWVDPELSETKKGDEMGLDKVVEALVDPDENTFDPEDEDEGDEDYVPQEKRKRKRNYFSSTEGEKDDSSDQHTEKRYCHCQGGSSGKMVACDGPACVREWFHLKCLGLQTPPETDKWYCDECKKEVGEDADDGAEDHQAKKRRKQESS